MSVLQRGWCEYCGAKLTKSTRSVDHITPKSSGGPNNWANYAAACQTCNANKGSRSLLEFLMEGGRRTQALILDVPVSIVDLTELGDLPKFWFDPLKVFTP